MPRPVTAWSAREQPINWFRAVIAGAAAASLMMGFVDIFVMLGVTSFSFETYVGSMILADRYGTHAWTVGVLANWALGGVFGLLYAYLFEYVLKRASARTGTFLGIAHAAVAACALFPFFQIIHHEMGTAPRPEFGFFGIGMGAATAVLLLTAHLLFGSTMGLFYGPVRADRVHARAWEPGDSGVPGEAGVVTDQDDPRESGFF